MIVSCLDCYATDIGQLALGNVQASVQNCFSNLKDMYKLQHQPVPSADVLGMLELRCYSAEAFTSSNSTVFKGCTVEGGCEVIKTVYKIALSVKQQVTSIECYECNGNKCNENNKFNGSTSIKMNHLSAVYLGILGILIFFLNGK